MEEYDEVIKENLRDKPEEEIDLRLNDLELEKSLSELEKIVEEIT